MCTLKRVFKIMVVFNQYDSNVDSEFLPFEMNRKKS